MQKWSWLALAIVVAFVGVAFSDDCSIESGESCPPACHFSCLDGCAVAPLDHLIFGLVVVEKYEEHQVELASSPLELDLPPDLIPPRA